MEGKREGMWREKGWCVEGRGRVCGGPPYTLLFPPYLYPWGLDRREGMNS